MDLDLSAALGRDPCSARGIADRLRAELDVHGLLIFRNQHDLTPEHHLAVAEWFGSIFPLPGRFQHAPPIPAPFSGSPTPPSRASRASAPPAGI